MNSIFSALVTFLQHNPSLLIFAALAAGYALGKVKFGTFSLGSTTSVLLVAIAIGALVLRNTEYDLGLIKTISFGFFIFAIGYRVGPDFVSGLKRGGMKYVIIAVFFCVFALISVILLAKVYGLNRGYAGGILGGALTQSSVIGTADGAILHLANQEVTSSMNLKSDVAVAYAVTYIFGTAGLIILLKVFAKLWKFDLPSEAGKAEAELDSVKAEDTIEAFHWSNLVMPRAYRVEMPGVIGSTVAEVRLMFPEYVAIDVLKRGDRIIEKITDDLQLKKGDVIVLTGYRRRIYKACEIIGPEVDDRYINEMLGEILSICLTNKELNGQTFRGIFSSYGQGCFVHGIYRQGHELPLGPGLKLNPVLLLGAMTGAGTCTAALNSVKEDAESSIPVIGYTVPYAIGNVLLTVWGALVVSLL